MTGTPGDPRFFAGRAPGFGRPAFAPSADASVTGDPTGAASAGPDHAAPAGADAGRAPRIGADPGAPVGGGSTGPTGHPAIDHALAGLSHPIAAPLADQVALYSDAHDGLRRALAEIDQA